MKDIFDACQFGDLTVKSRVVRTGLWKSGDLFENYRKMASSGVGLIITEIMSLYSKDKFSEYSYKTNSPNFLVEAKKLAEICHEFDTPVLGHLEFIKYNRGIDLDINVNDLEIEDIRQIQSDIIVAAQKLKLAGFDGLQLAVGNNFYLSKVINPYYNQRDDDYGGNTFNRCRLILELIKVMKNNFDFHISCKVNAFDGRKGGIGAGESIEICKLLEKVGTDSIQVTKPLSPLYFTKENSCEDEMLKFCEKLTDSVDIPVILGGGFNEMSHMNDILNNSKIEFISMYRPFISKSDFLSEWKLNGEGKSDCLMCNNCYRTKTSSCYHQSF